MDDLYWNSSGDFVLDPVDNDLMDTKKLNYRGAIQRILTRLQSSKGDWKSSPQTGANLKRYVGMPNSAEIGREIENAILNELVRSGLVSPQELTVQAFPISEGAIATIVQVTPAGQRESITLVHSYNLVDNKLTMRN